MPSPLLTSADYPQIRAAVDVSLTPARAPDAVLDMPIYAPGACADVLARDPGAEARSGLAGDAVHRAAVYFAAARLALGLREIKSEAFGDVRVDFQQSDLAERAASLASLGEQSVAAALALDGVAVAAPAAGFAAFGLARARRRWVSAW